MEEDRGREKEDEGKVEKKGRREGKKKKREKEKERRKEEIPLIWWKIRKGAPLKKKEDKSYLKESRT